MNSTDSAFTPVLEPPRLNSGQVEEYRREGYFIYRKPVLSAERFDALRDYFEQILEGLPGSTRPEAMDVPHFLYPKLLEWATEEAITSLVEPILGPNLALFSTHFICKPKGNGRRVPWHEDSAYWRGRIVPMEVCTVWLAIDPSTKANGCMMVIPRTHVTGLQGFSDYDAVDPLTNVFASEVKPSQRDDASRVYIELEPNQCSLHNARVIHGSEPNHSNIRRCGWTLRFCSSSVKFDEGKFDGAHQVYLAKGRDLGGNRYADPTQAYPEMMARRGMLSAYKHAH